MAWLIGFLRANSAWFILFLAGVCEILWAIGLKKFGFRFTWGGAATVAGMLLSFLLLERAMRSLPLGTAYGVWTGIGAVGTAAFGMAFLGESADWRRVLCIALVVGGIVGLKALAPQP
jgi:quaternary ammonium compound-resistance protein SugE